MIRTKSMLLKSLQKLQLDKKPDPLPLPVVCDAVKLAAAGFMGEAVERVLSSAAKA
jgi:ATP-dependent protease Clp ATPase subunit